MSAASYAGIPLALLTTSAFNTGLILEKWALGRMPTLDVRRVAHPVGSLLANPAWLAGIALAGLVLVVLSRQAPDQVNQATGKQSVRAGAL